MKICSECKQKKELSEFRNYARSKDGKAPSCKMCRRSSEREYYQNNSSRREAMERRKQKCIKEYWEFIVEHLSSNHCVDCGESNPIKLEFDHLESKENNISSMRTHSIKSVREEVAKCEVVCANCHRVRTAKRAGYYRNIPEWVAHYSGKG